MKHTLTNFLFMQAILLLSFTLNFMLAAHSLMRHDMVDAGIYTFFTAVMGLCAIRLPAPEER
jgi:hypothetical protein